MQWLRVSPGVLYPALAKLHAGAGKVSGLRCISLLMNALKDRSYV